MRQRMKYHEQENILEIDFSNLYLESNQQIDAIKEAVQEIAEPLEHKVFALVNYKNFKVKDEIKGYYSQVIKEMYRRYSRGTVRYSTNSLTKTLIISAMRGEKTSSETFSNREDALEEIKRLQERERTKTGRD